MTPIILDSSVLGKWFLRETDSPAALTLLRDALAGREVIVLDLALIEVANAIWKRHHRGLLSSSESSELVAKLHSSPARSQPSAALLASGFEIAVKYDRSIYDALFVALCAELGAAGLTADEPLYRAVVRDFPMISLFHTWAASISP
jgi:predicted nucleic acid-binding protein